MQELLKDTRHIEASDKAHLCIRVYRVWSLCGVGLVQVGFRIWGSGVDTSWRIVEIRGNKLSVRATIVISYSRET